MSEGKNALISIERKKHHSPKPETLSSTVYALSPTLWKQEEQGLRCLACARQCLLHRESIGYCTAVVNWEDTLYSTAYGVVGEASVTPIENRPVYHYKPGSKVLCIGGLGCNLRCAFCQNWEVAFRDARHGGGIATPNLLPEKAIALAIEQQCEGIAWTFNEPSIAPMYTLECARLARQAGLYTVFVTNGFMTHEALDLLGPWLDVYRVDIKSIEPLFYQKVAGTTHITDIFPVAKRAQEEFGIHVETVTNLMPSLNDSTEHLSSVAGRIVEFLGADTPWHLTSYVPYAHMTAIAPTDTETLLRAQAIGVHAGLRFVYTDSPEHPETAHTFCPTCGALVIERTPHSVVIHALDAARNCAACGTALPIVPPSSGLFQQKEVSS